MNERERGEPRAGESSAGRARIVEADRARVWHPYTAMRPYLERGDPFVIERAQGSRLFDANGRSYIDANSSWWVASLGHGHPRLVEALARQASRLCHTSLAGVTHEPAALLAEELAAAAPPGLERVFYTDNGSTAIEAAMKMALQLHALRGRPERTRFLALSGAFHGETLGAASLGGIEVFRRPFASVLLDCVHVPPPLPGEEGEAQAFQDAFGALSSALDRARSEIAAVVIEPRVQGASGMRIYDDAFMREVRALCDATGALLIVDEVFSGYGRTGSMWACEGAGVRPDLLCVGKGFSGGMLPMAAVLATGRVFDAFTERPETTFHYGHSYCGNPLGAAVAREVLRVYRDEAVLERARPKAARIAAAFSEIGRMPGAFRARALGMIGAVDLAPSPAYTGDAGWLAFEEARRLGAILRPLGDTVYVAPPLNIPDPDLDELLEIVRASCAFALGL